MVYASELLGSDRRRARRSMGTPARIAGDEAECGSGGEGAGEADAEARTEDREDARRVENSVHCARAAGRWECGGRTGGRAAQLRQRQWQEAGEAEGR
jgi:hypothetical protein